MNPMLIGYILGVATAYGFSLGLVGAWIGGTELLGWARALRAQRDTRNGRVRA